MTAPFGPTLRPAVSSDAAGLIELWQAAGLRVRRTSVADLAAELERLGEREPRLALVLAEPGGLVGSLIGTFDGRRGWVNRLAVLPERQGRGLGRMLLGSFEDRLRELGCRKINLLVAADNAEVVEFYRAAGYDREEMLFLERWL